VAEILYEYMKGIETKDLYARFLAIVQSSGMGKSRMIDEFSKTHFVIPFNLRDQYQGKILSICFYFILPTFLTRISTS
jgi:hypothetical protein